MANLCGNFLFISGGSNENIQKISEAFSSPSSKGVFESLIGRNPSFPSELPLHHDIVTYGIDDEINDVKFYVKPHKAYQLVLSFTTNGKMPLSFVNSLSRIYDIETFLFYISFAEKNSGGIVFESGKYLQSILLPNYEFLYKTNPDFFINEIGRPLVAEAIKDGLTEEGFISRDLYFMRPKDRNQLIRQFRIQKSKSQNN
jgi:hypothetical protein